MLQLNVRYDLWVPVGISLEAAGKLNGEPTGPFDHRSDSHHRGRRNHGLGQVLRGLEQPEFSGISPPEEADMPTKAKPKKLSTRDGRVGRLEVKTYRVKSAAKEKPAKAEAIRERFVKH